MGFEEVILNSIGNEAMFVMYDGDNSITVRDIVDDVLITDDGIDVMLEAGGEVTIGNWKMVEAEDRDGTHFSLPNQMEIFIMEG